MDTSTAIPPLFDVLVCCVVGLLWLCGRQSQAGSQDRDRETEDARHDLQGACESGG